MTTELIEQLPFVKPAQPPVLYSVTDETIDRMELEYLPLRINGIDDKNGLAKVHEARMSCVRARTAVEKARKEMKAESLEYGRKVDAEAKRITQALEPIERHLTQQEEAVERELDRIQKEKDDARYAVRLEKLTAAGGSCPEAILRPMTDEDFDALVIVATEQTRLRLEAERIEAEKRAELVRIQAEEDAKRKAEDERLAAERAELDRQREEQDRELRERAAAQKAEQDRLDAIAAEQQAERDRLAAEEKRLADEAREREESRLAEIKRREEIDAQAARLVAQAEAARAEREAQIARDAAAYKAKLDAEEEARRREEAMRPDREKLEAFSETVANLEIPRLSDGMEEIVLQVQACLRLTADEIRRIAASELDMVGA